MNAVLNINAGAGGVDAHDWAEILFRMYTRFLDSEKMEYEIEEISSGEEAGIKSVSIRVKSYRAYGILESERGVHRLVRISPFDSNKRRHTSFAGIDVVPLIEDSDEIVIKDDEIRVDVYRSSGAGGQHVNTTDSAVRITHLPTGAVVACQAERSQLQNKIRALDLLKSKIVNVQPSLRRMVDSDDLVQSVFAEIWGNLPDFEFTTRGAFISLLSQRMKWKASNESRRMRTQKDEKIFEQAPPQKRLA